MAHDDQPLRERRFTIRVSYMKGDIDKTVTAYTLSGAIGLANLLTAPEARKRKLGARVSTTCIES